MKGFRELAGDLASNVADQLVVRGFIDLSGVAEHYPGVLRVNDSLRAMRSVIIEQVSALIETGDPFDGDSFLPPDDRDLNRQ